MTNPTPATPLPSEEVVAKTCDALLAEFVTKAEPAARKVAETVYETLLYSVQDYLRENANWNLAQEIERCRRTELENLRLCDEKATLVALNAELVGALTAMLREITVEGALSDETGEEARAIIAKARGEG